MRYTPSTFQPAKLLTVSIIPPIVITRSTRDAAKLVLLRIFQKQYLTFLHGLQWKRHSSEESMKIDNIVHCMSNAYTDDMTTKLLCLLYSIHIKRIMMWILREWVGQGYNQHGCSRLALFVLTSWRCGVAFWWGNIKTRGHNRQ